MRTPAETAQLALLLEVASTPTPGAVDRDREHEDLRFEQFLAGAVGAMTGLERAEQGDSLGSALETAVEGMAAQSATNTQFGALCLLVPLVHTATRSSDLSPETVADGLEETTVEDTVSFFRAFDHVEVSVGEPPAELDALDVRRGSDAIPDVRDRGLTLRALMERSASEDGIAAEWASNYERSFDVAATIRSGTGTLSERAATAFLEALGTEPDTHIAQQHGQDTAEWVRDRAASIEQTHGQRGALASSGQSDRTEELEAFASELTAREINPGTTADILASGLFIALEAGETI